MVDKPVAITSPAHPASLAAYAAFTSIGWMYLNTAQSRWFEDSIGNTAALALMTLLMIAGVAAFLSCIFAAFSRDPSVGLSWEIYSLVPVFIISALLLGVGIFTFGLNITVVLLGWTVLGTLGRLIQAGVERWRLSKAKKAAKLAVTATLADPKG